MVKCTRRFPTPTKKNKVWNRKWFLIFNTTTTTVTRGCLGREREKIKKKLYFIVQLFYPHIHFWFALNELVWLTLINIFVNFFFFLTKFKLLIPVTVPQNKGSDVKGGGVKKSDVEVSFTLKLKDSWIFNFYLLHVTRS